MNNNDHLLQVGSSHCHCTLIAKNIAYACIASKLLKNPLTAVLATAGSCKMQQGHQSGLTCGHRGRADIAEVITQLSPHKYVDADGHQCLAGKLDILVSQSLAQQSLPVLQRGCSG